MKRTNLIPVLLIGLSLPVVIQYFVLSIQEWSILAWRNELRPVNGKIIFTEKLVELKNQIKDLSG